MSGSVTSAGPYASLHITPDSSQNHRYNTYYYSYLNHLWPAVRQQDLVRRHTDIQTEHRPSVDSTSRSVRTPASDLHSTQHRHKHPFNGPFSGTTRVNRYQKGKPIWILLKQQTVSGISWDICKSATRSRQITMPAPHHSVFYRPDALAATQPTASKHWRHYYMTHTNTHLHKVPFCTGTFINNNRNYYYDY